MSFESLVEEFGYTVETARTEAEMTHDRIDIDLDKLGIRVAKSEIEGVGLISMKTFSPDDVIGAARFEGMRTQLGRYANHSDTPNAVPIRWESNIYYLATERIDPGDEITIDYRESLQIRKEDTLHKIMSAEQFLATLPQTEVEPIHTFAYGTYAREITIPKGVFCTGKVHRYDDFNIVVYGHMKVMTQDGYKEVKGPCTFVGKSGDKKMGYALEDTKWITIHSTFETDLDVLEKTLYIDDEDGPKVIDFKTGKEIQPCLHL